MRCSICDKQKETNNFQTYWHSTQQKMRTRRQCTECLYKKRMKNRNPDKYYQDKPEYKKCNTCFEWKLIDDGFYHRNNKAYTNRCKQCELNVERDKRKQYLIDNCGSDMVLITPNKYVDEYQKNCTFNMMETMGYTFDEATGIWIKPGVKEILDGKPYFPKIKKYVHKSGTHVTTNMLKEIIELRKLNWGINKIADKLKISDTTVYNHLKKYG